MAAVALAVGIAAAAAAADIWTGIAKLYALPGLHLAGVRNYSATITVRLAQARKSTLSCNSFTVLRRICSPWTKIKTVTVGFWTNSTGWPVRVSTTGQSAIVHVAIGKILACHQHMTITAP